MTFTYDSTLATDLAKIRLRIQDTTASPSGIKPLGANFTDEEINSVYATEGTIPRAVAALYEILAVAWANYVDTKIGPRDEKLSQAAARYDVLARQLRTQYGYGTTVTLSTGFVTRQDAYSDDLDASETESL